MSRLPAPAWVSMACAWVAVSAALWACYKATGMPTTVDTSLYGGEQLDCVDRADSAPEADACRAASRARFCVRFPQEPNCHGRDGG
jgi:hypothetical protein